MKVEIQGFYPKLKKRIEGYEFEVGVLEKTPHFEAESKIRGLRSFAGTSARKRSRRPDGNSQAIGAKLQGFYGWLSHPFRDGNEKQKELQLFAQRYLAEVQKDGQVNVKRLENLVQAIVRNPILRQDYGSNKPSTAKIKGFDHLMIDTAQFFNSVKARLLKNV